MGVKGATRLARRADGFVDFEFHSDLDPVSGCLEWNRLRDEDGYGRAMHGSRCLYVHRVAYEVANGPIPDGVVVMHTCDNPPCVNPDHLVAGTVAENNADRNRKGRQAIGARIRPDHYTPDQLREMHRRICQDGEKAYPVALSMGISRSGMRYAIASAYPEARRECGHHEVVE